MSARHMSDTPLTHDTFASQLPIALLFLAAVVAIVFVNTGPRSASKTSPSPPAAIEVMLQPVCGDCGEVVAAGLAEAATDRGPAPRAAVIFQVRMLDGTVRAFRDFEPGVSIGDRVRVIGGSLTLLL
jgi:hypothetical protein